MYQWDAHMLIKEIQKKNKELTNFDTAFINLIYDKRILNKDQGDKLQAIYRRVWRNA